MGLIEDCEKCFQVSSLYEILGVEKTAEQPVIKKAFYNKSLQYHPDRNVAANDQELLTLKFQTVNKVFKILSDNEKRKVYDETGEVDDSDATQLRNFMAFWRSVFPKFTKKDIDAFENKYKYSSEEKEDIKKYYLEFEGNMDKIFEWLMLAQISEENRYREVIQQMIDSEEVPPFKAFTHEPKKKRDARKRKYEREAKEAEEIENQGGLEDLTAAILMGKEKRYRDQNNFLASLEAKYAKKPTKKVAKK